MASNPNEEMLKSVGGTSDATAVEAYDKKHGSYKISADPSSTISKGKPSKIQDKPFKG